MLAGHTLLCHFVPRAGAVFAVTTVMRAKWTILAAGAISSADGAERAARAEFFAKGTCAASRTLIDTVRTVSAIFALVRTSGTVVAIVAKFRAVSAACTARATISAKRAGAGQESFFKGDSFAFVAAFVTTTQ
jgi:hypothetical protein